MHTIAPLVLRPGTPVEVTGTVLNRRRQTWGDVQVGLVTSTVPITSQGELEKAARAELRDPGRYIGDRIVDSGTFDDIGTITPGGQVAFSLRVPYESLAISGEPGVYRLGVQVNANVASGRAVVAQQRTFIPLLDPAQMSGTVQLAALWPVTGGVPKAAHGYRRSTLAAAFADGGRLDAISEMGAEAADWPLSWAVDPALLVAARDLANGFRRRSGAAAGRQSLTAQRAGRWHDLTLEALGNAEVWALPYGDPDVSSLAHHQLVPVLAKAHRQGTNVLNRLQVGHRNLLWPAAGMADADVLATAPRLEADAALLSRDSVVSAPRHAVSVTAAGTALPAVLHEGDLDRAGLRPRRGQTVLAWRQEVLATTALMALRGGTDNGTAVVAPSREWWPDGRWRDADFFSAFDAFWVDPVPVSTVTATLTPDPAAHDSTLPASRLRYPRSARRAELPTEHLSAIRDLLRIARTVISVMDEQASWRRSLNAALGRSASTHWRAAPVLGRVIARSHVRDSRELLRVIDIETPSFVTLSSQTGQFPVTITNGSEETVVVGLGVEASGTRLDVETIEPVTIEPGQRRSIPVITDAESIGISNVEVHLQSRTGRVFGPGADFQVRTTQIGAVIWVVMGVAFTVLLLASARRITLRVMAHRRGRVR